MSEKYIVYAWVFGGIFLMVLELLMPGMIIVFLGASSVIVGILYWAGILSDFVSSFVCWFILSFLLTLLFRRVALKFFPSESKYQLVEDDVEAIGAIVEVIHDVDENSTDGRIMYNGTSWQAISNNGLIEKGKKAKLLYRDNISWVIEPIE